MCRHHIKDGMLLDRKGKFIIKKLRASGLSSSLDEKLLLSSLMKGKPK